MVKRCVIEDCTLESDYSQLFHFPKDLKLLDQWISKLPLSNLTNFNLKDAVICEHHFKPEKLIEGPGFKKELVEGAVPEYFPTIPDVDVDSCRFCLRKIAGEKILLDDLIKFHYQNLMHVEWNPEFLQWTCCESCYISVLNCSHIKSKIQENQIILANLPQSEFLEIKMEVLDSNEELENEMSYQESETIERKRKRSKKSRSSKKSLEESLDAKPESLVEFSNQIRTLPKATETVRALCKFCNTYNNDIRRHIYLRHKKQYREIKEAEKQARAKLTKGKKRVWVPNKNKVRKMCLICNRDYDNINIHNRRVHERKRRFQCDHCGSAFFTRREIRIHVKVHEKYRERNFFCDICNSSFLTEKILKCHQDKFHIKRNLVYCEICGESFVCNSHYQVHYRSRHTGERPFKCDKCAYSAFSHYAIRDHIITFHLSKRYPCQFCKKELRSEKTYNDHLVRLHSGTKFQCSYPGCNGFFSRNDSLREHVKLVHLKIKNHQCNTCGTEFLRKNSLDRHILTTHMKYKFLCEACQFQVGSKRSYKQHVLKNHQDLGENVVQSLLDKVKNFSVPNVKMM